MSRRLLLGIANLISAFLFGRMLLYSVTVMPLGKYPLKAYLSATFLSPNIILLTFLALNLYLAYALLRPVSTPKPKKDQLPFMAYLFMSCAPIIWYIQFIASWFFASAPIFLVFSIGAVGAMYIVSKAVSKNSKFATYLLTGITCLIVLVSFITGFAEAYCLQKGIEADPTNQKTVTATQEESSYLKETFNIDVTQPVGLSFKTEMLCRRDFKFGPALMDAYGIR